jgi:hypothetical protein
MSNPRTLLEALAKKLTGDGFVVVTTGDGDNFLWNFFGANWWYCFYPEHITFISEAWLRRALQPRGWRVLDCKRFRYIEMNLGRRIRELMLACVYGVFPRAYLFAGNALRRLLGRGSVTGVAGNGASADHLLITLARRCS